MSPIGDWLSSASPTVSRSAQSLEIFVQDINFSCETLHSVNSCANWFPPSHIMLFLSADLRSVGLHRLKSCHRVFTQS